MEPAMIKLNQEMSLARNVFLNIFWLLTTYRTSVEKQYYVMQKGLCWCVFCHSSPRIQLKNELEKVRVRGKHKSRIAVAASKTQTKMRNSLNLVLHLQLLLIISSSWQAPILQVEQTLQGIYLGQALIFQPHVYNLLKKVKNMILMLKWWVRLMNSSSQQFTVGQIWLFMEERE